MLDAATLVWTPQGAVPIFLLKVGDEILAWNARTQRISTREITKVDKQTSDHLRIVGDLRTTDDHPFLAESGAWTPIGGLAADAHVRTVIGNEALGPTERIDGDVEVYKIEVDGLNTYLVGERKLIAQDK